MGGPSGAGSEDNDWWDDPTFTVYIIQKRGVFYGFVLDAFVCKLVIDICELYELYFDVWIKVRWWGAIVWDSLNTGYVRFRTGIAMASWGSDLFRIVIVGNEKKVVNDLRSQSGIY